VVQGNDASNEDMAQADAGVSAQDASAILVLDAARAISGDAGEGCSTVHVKSELKRIPVDVIWAIDSSGSMGGEQRRVKDNLGRFAQAFSTAEVDAHVVIVNKCDIAQETALRGSASYLWVDETISSRNALDKLLKSFDRWQGQLRATAATHVIVVSDDNAALSADEFRTQLTAKLQHPFVLHAIASEDVGRGEPCQAMNCSEAEGACGGWVSLTPCKAAQPGLVYFELAQQTGGEQISICQDDWGDVFTRLERALVAASALPCRFRLPTPPAGRSLEPNLVRLDYTPPGESTGPLRRASQATACGSERGWYFDQAAAPSEILLCPAACEAAKLGGELSIALVCSEAEVPVILL
jgi:hypothetical protein